MDERVDCVKIQWIEFENLKTGLKIERINFNKDITLLVGLSGVGKTQILNAVEYSLGLALSKSAVLRPYRAGIGLLIDGDEYEWFYEIGKTSEYELTINGEEKYRYLFERLECNGKKIFERNDEEVSMIGYSKVPQPKKDESLILQYSEDENVEALISGIRKLYSVEMELEIRGGIASESFGRLKTKIADVLGDKEDVEFKRFSHQIGRASCRERV